MTDTAYEDYVHHGWCREIFSRPGYRDTAVSALKKMGVSDAGSMHHHELCEELAQKTCRVSSMESGSCSTDSKGRDIPSDRRIAIRCGGKLQCWDVNDLDNHINENSEFAASLSLYQRNKVQRKLAAVKTNLNQVLPCFVLSGNPGACGDEKGRCGYHERSLLLALFSSASNNRYSDGECHLTSQYIKSMNRKTCMVMEAPALRALVDDINHDHLSSSMTASEFRNLSIYEEHVAQADFSSLMDKMKKDTATMERDDLCTIITDYQQEQDVGARAKSSWTWKKLGSLLEKGLKRLGIAERYLSIDVLMNMVKAVGLAVSEVTVRVMSHMVNLVVFLYENMFVSWGVWLLAFPGGRAAVRKMLTDPVHAVFFFLSFSLVGLTDPLLPDIQKLNIELPMGDMSSMIANAIGMVGEKGLKTIDAEKIPQAMKQFGRGYAKKAKMVIQRRRKKRVSAAGS